MSTLQDALELCRTIEPIAERCGGHVALTGGTLYKDGDRKDLDILIYRLRQVKAFDWDKFKRLSAVVGIYWGPDYGWCKKAIWGGHRIDFFDPDAVSGHEYPTGVYELIPELPLP